MRSQSQGQSLTSCSSHSSTLGSSPRVRAGLGLCWELGLHLRWEDKKQNGQGEKGYSAGSSSQEQKARYTNIYRGSQMGCTDKLTVEQGEGDRQNLEFVPKEMSQVINAGHPCGLGTPRCLPHLTKTRVQGACGSRAGLGQCWRRRLTSLSCVICTCSP